MDSWYELHGAPHAPIRQQAKLGEQAELIVVV